jgi:hypothetical protein
MPANSTEKVPPKEKMAMKYYGMKKIVNGYKRK